MKQLLGTYGGIVESIEDPEKRGRVKVRVPTVYGPAGGSIATGDLPWALPAGLPAGGSEASGGIDWLPEKGDQVWVRFLDGEPEKPIWEWALQNSDQAKGFAFRNYTGSTPNKHALLRRYGHNIEFSPGGIGMTTSKGYSIQLIDASNAAFDGSIELSTGRGNFIRMLDQENMMAMACPFINAVYTELLFHGVSSSFVMSSTFDVKAPVYTSINSPRITLGLNARDPVVRRSDLQNVVRQIVASFNTHVHPKVPPPVKPMKVRVTSSLVVYAK